MDQPITGCRTRSQSGCFTADTGTPTVMAGLDTLASCQRQPRKGKMAARGWAGGVAGSWTTPVTGSTHLRKLLCPVLPAQATPGLLTRPWTPPRPEAPGKDVSQPAPVWPLTALPNAFCSIQPKSLCLQHKPTSSPGYSQHLLWADSQQPRSETNPFPSLRLPCTKHSEAPFKMYAADPHHF